jgi:hypothetical protein
LVRSSLEGDVQAVATGFVVLQPVGHDSEGQGLDMGSRLIFGGTVGQHPGHLDDFCDPAPVVLALEFHPEDDRHIGPPSIPPRPLRIYSLRIADDQGPR